MKLSVNLKEKFNDIFKESDEMFKVHGLFDGCNINFPNFPNFPNDLNNTFYHYDNILSQISNYKTLEEDGKYVIVFEMAGFSKDDIQINIIDKSIEVIGVSKSKYTKDFESKVKVPIGYDLKSCDAELKDGLLVCKFIKINNEIDKINIKIK